MAQIFAGGESCRRSNAAERIQSSLRKKFHPRSVLLRLSACSQVNTLPSETKEVPQMPETADRSAASIANTISTTASKFRVLALLAIPLASAVALTVHFCISKNRPVDETR